MNHYQYGAKRGAVGCKTTCYTKNDVPPRLLNTDTNTADQVKLQGVRRPVLERLPTQNRFISMTTAYSLNRQCLLT